MITSLLFMEKQINLSVWIKEICTLLAKLHIICSRMQRVNLYARPSIIQMGCPTCCYRVCALDHAIGVLQTRITPQSPAIIMNIQTHTKDRYLEHFLCNCPLVNAIRPHWWSVNIRSGNGSVLLGNVPLPRPMLTQICAAIWYHQPHQATMS